MWFFNSSSSKRVNSVLAQWTKPLEAGKFFEWLYVLSRKSEILCTSSSIHLLWRKKFAKKPALQKCRHPWLNLYILLERGLNAEMCLLELKKECGYNLIYNELLVILLNINNFTLKISKYIWLIILILFVNDFEILCKRRGAANGFQLLYATRIDPR